MKIVHGIVIGWLVHILLQQGNTRTLEADKRQRPGCRRRTARRRRRRALALGSGRIVRARLRRGSRRERREFLLLLRRRRLLDDGLLPLPRGRGRLRRGEVRLGRPRLLGSDWDRRGELLVLDERGKILHVALHPHVKDPVPFPGLGWGFIVDEHCPDWGRLAVADRRVRACLQRLGHLLHYPLHTWNRKRRPSNKKEIDLTLPLSFPPRATQIAPDNRSDQLSFGMFLTIQNDVRTQGSDPALSLGQS